MNNWRSGAFESYFRDSLLGDLFYKASLELNVALIDFQLVNDLKKRYPGQEREFALLFLMTAHYLNEGSICVDVSSTGFNEKLRAIAGGELCDLLENLKAGTFQSFVETSPTTVKPLIFCDNFLYFYKNFRLESSLYDHCQRLLKQTSADIDLAVLKKVLQRILDSLPYQLHQRQLLGVIAGVLNKFAIITGGPGTGKTSVLATLLRVLLHMPGAELDKVRLVAPTGKAAQRMTDAIRGHLEDLEECSLVDKSLINLQASTIHRLIQTYTKEKICLNVKILVIDEVSMVDAQLMDELLKALPSDCRVIFLGDKYQLPSVAAGQVLADLLPQGNPQYSADFIFKVKSLLAADTYKQMALKECQDMGPLTDKLVLLTKSYRSSPEIVELSQVVNSGNEEQIKAFYSREDLLLVDEHELTEGLPLFEFAHEEKPFPDEWFVQRPSVQFYWEQFIEEAFVYSWFEQCFNGGEANYLQLLNEVNSHIDEAVLDDLFSKIEASRILSFTRSGSHGVGRLNQYGAQYLRTKTGDYNHEVYFHGAPIMITKNDYGRSLFNGDVGLILRHEGSFKAYFRRENSFVSFSVELLIDFELSFAMTIHKSQGSEYNQVLIVLPDNRDHRLLSREILYTGLTRAKKNCIITGDEEVFRLACLRKIHRHSRVALWQGK